MVPTLQFAHTYGYQAQRLCCPLLVPEQTGATCDHVQFIKGKGCVKDLNWELGGHRRVTLDRDSPLFKVVSRQRGNSRAIALGLERPKVRTIHSVRHLNTLTYLIINALALQRARARNASCLTTCLDQVI